MPEDRIFAGFDAYQKALAAGPDVVLLATPPGFRPSIMPRPLPPANTSSWRSRAASTPPASAPLMETNKQADEKGLKVAVGLQRRHSKEFLGKSSEFRRSLGD